MKWIYNQLSTDSSSSQPPLSLALLYHFLLFLSFLSLSSSSSIVISLSLSPCSRTCLSPYLSPGLTAFRRSQTVLRGSVSNIDSASLVSDSLSPLWTRICLRTRTFHSAVFTHLICSSQYVSGWMSVIFQSVELLKNLTDREGKSCQHSHLFENVIIPLLIPCSGCVSVVLLSNDKQTHSHVAVEVWALWKLIVKLHVQMGEKLKKNTIRCSLA